MQQQHQPHIIYSHLSEKYIKQELIVQNPLTQKQIDEPYLIWMAKSEIKIYFFNPDTTASTITAPDLPSLLSLFICLACSLKQNREKII